MDNFPIKVGDIFEHYKKIYGYDGLVKPKKRYKVVGIIFPANEDSPYASEPRIVYRDIEWPYEKPSVYRKISDFLAYVKADLSDKHQSVLRFTLVEKGE